MKKLLSFASLLALSACQVHVMDSDLVSMTTKEAPKGAITKGETIQEEWCLNDDPMRKEPDNRYGMMDQVILKAQKKHNARYIADAQFYAKTSCMTVTGTVVK